MHGERDQVQGEGLAFQVAVSLDKEILRVLAEAEEAEPLRKFHDRAGFGLLWSGPFAHLLLRADDLQRVLAADAEVDRNAEPPLVDAEGPLKNVQIEFLELCPETPHRLFRCDDLVLIQGVAFVSIFKNDLVTQLSDSFIVKYKSITKAR